MTGATRGIGRATAMGLARLGATVVMVGRDDRRLDEARIEAKRETGNERVYWVHADFASLASVRLAAEEIAHQWSAIDVLINNAGINSARRVMSTDGYEMTLAVNHLAPFLLTILLVPALARGAPSRVVNVTSVFAHFGRVNVDDLMFERRFYTSTRAYNQSKLANVMFTIELATRVERVGIAVNCVSPGLVATDLMREHAWSSIAWPITRRILRTPEQAASRVVRVASSEAVAGATGQCFGASEHSISAPRRAQNADVRRRLWDVSAKLTAAPDVAATTGGFR